MLPDPRRVSDIFLEGAHGRNPRGPRARLGRSPERPGARVQGHTRPGEVPVTLSPILPAGLRSDPARPRHQGEVPGQGRLIDHEDPHKPRMRASPLCSRASRIVNWSPSIPAAERLRRQPLLRRARPAARLRSSTELIMSLCDLTPKMPVAHGRGNITPYRCGVLIQKRPPKSTGRVNRRRRHALSKLPRPAPAESVQ